ncbi:uncharacterized protein LOC102878873 [Pteropus alecto]|uniref:uncharacterized protein LOC102878873 n=1 Tax=Pteropus alecto TaxID=9402 RepID=UPI0007685E7D|nr:uncharacterized protein LOC102878873 [Pteropus alecto]
MALALTFGNVAVTSAERPAPLPQTRREAGARAAPSVPERLQYMDLNPPMSLPSRESVQGTAETEKQLGSKQYQGLALSSYFFHRFGPRAVGARIPGPHQHSKQPLVETPGTRTTEDEEDQNVVGESIATVSLFSRLSFVLLQHSEQPPSTGLSLHQRLAGAFTTGFYILHVRTHNLWSVRIQAPVRFEWAIKLRVPLPTPSRRAQAGVPAARSGPARPGLRPRSWVGLGAATQACGSAHLFPPLLIPMSHLPPPKTNFRTAAATWLGWPKTRMEEAGDPHPPAPEDHGLGPPPSSRRSPDASRLLPPSWFGPKPSSGILRGTGPPTWDPQHPHL